MTATVGYLGQVIAIVVVVLIGLGILMWARCKRRCKSDPGRRMRSDPPDTLGVSRWEAPDADRGRGRGDPSAAPARNEHPRDCENDWDIAQRGSALSAHTGSAALQKAGAEAIKTRSI